MRITNSLQYVFLLLGLCLSSTKSIGQETSAMLSGTVRDDKKELIPIATIVVKYEPTGSVTSTETSINGRFTIVNLKPGGPYTISAFYAGFDPFIMPNIFLSLGENPSLDIAMKNAAGTTLKEVKVSANRGGAGSTNINNKQLQTLPTLSRSLSDFTRITPQSNNNSFAGTSFRYNNITMDGAVNNDAIGFSNSFGGQSGGGQAGTAGAGTRTTPYSMETIQEVQVQLAPYDVKLGNFTGGSINAVTKSGTNELHGNAYLYGRNAAMVGSFNGKMPSSFHDYQAGITLGGPILKNKLFFFTNFEIARRKEPTFYNAGDQGAPISVAQAEQIRNHMISKYGYDPGAYGPATISTNADKFFARLDYNINKKNTLSFRTIYTTGSGQNLERSSTNFQFGNTDFTQHTNNLNMVAELKSTIQPNLYNSLIGSYINVHEYRDFPGQLAPFISINSDQIWLGTWREATIYNLRQKTYELTDNLTWIKNHHKLTLGTHNEFYNINYGFVNSWNGRWEYSSINSFLADQPSRIRGAYNFSTGENTRQGLYNNVPGSTFNVNLLSGYIQDEWSISSRLKITPGIRVDYAMLPKAPNTDSVMQNLPDFQMQNGQSSYSHTPFASINNKWLNNASISPRLGFNWDVNGDKNLVIRGGSGIFVGRMPFAWLGYAYTLSGNQFGNIDYNNIQTNGTKTIGLAMDPSTLRDTVTKYGGASKSATRELNIVDNNLHLPTVWRSNIAADIKWADGWKLTLDAMYTKTIYDVKFQQINKRDSFFNYQSGPTQTPVYQGSSMSSRYSNIYLLSNTSEGYRYNFTAQLSKSTSNIAFGNKQFSLYNSLAYTYGLSKDVANGIRNSFQSNYEVNPAISPENPQLAYSNFDLRHRIVSVHSINLKWNEHHNSNLAFFYSGQSGSPYSVIYSSSPNAFNNSSNATLAYIPANANDIKLSDVKDANGNITYSVAQQRADMETFIEGNSYLSQHRGQYAERNALRTPWNHNLDLKLMHTWNFNVSKTRTNSLQLSLDIFNVLNLMNNNWGKQYFVSNVSNYCVPLFKAVNDQNGKTPSSQGYAPTYQFQKPTNNGQYYTVDPISSRWQMQVGIKYSF
ncbi:MAG: TonB-dependent receptor [Bacteroidetes bacterium]|nr:TonB-dependent receptor [Bacteroidota bacterium]